MLKAVKANKEYSISEDMKQRYLDDGYDIYDEKGNIVEYSPKKKIEYSKYAALVEENDKLKKELSKLKKGASGKKGDEKSPEDARQKDKADE